MFKEAEEAEPASEEDLLQVEAQLQENPKAELDLNHVFEFLVYKLPSLDQAVFSSQALKKLLAAHCTHPSALLRMADGGTPAQMDSMARCG